MRVPDRIPADRSVFAATATLRLGLGGKLTTTDCGQTTSERVGGLTSEGLCHLLKELGYPCMKPDSGVLASAASLGIVATKRNYNDSDRRVAVETLQRCCIPLRTEMAVLDLYLLINGGMLWARQFVRSDYYA